MNKTNNYRIPTGKNLVEGIPNSPYFKVACEVLYRRKIDKPNIADLFEVFHEIAKVDNKINKRRKKCFV